MKEILSKDNKLIKEFSKLKQKKYVEETDNVLIEGIKLINEAEKNNIKLLSVFTNFYTDEDFNCPTYFLSESAFKSLSSTVSPQGVVAVINLPKQKFCLPKKNFLILDGIQDPGNFGTIVRTALACGFCEIYTRNCVDFRNEKVIRSTMGTIFGSKIMEIDLNEFKQLLKYKVYCANMNKTNIFELKEVPKQFGIVMGNEAHGISEEILSCDLEQISLPMKNKVESLNVAVSCGIMMYILSSKQN